MLPNLLRCKTACQPDISTNPDESTTLLIKVFRIGSSPPGSPLRAAVIRARTLQERRIVLERAWKSFAPWSQQPTPKLHPVVLFYRSTSINVECSPVLTTAAIRSFGFREAGKRWKVRAGHVSIAGPEDERWRKWKAAGLESNRRKRVCGKERWRGGYVEEMQIGRNTYGGSHGEDNTVSQMG